VKKRDEEDPNTKKNEEEDGEDAAGENGEYDRMSDRTQLMLLGGMAGSVVNLVAFCIGLAWGFSTGFVALVGLALLSLAFASIAYQRLDVPKKLSRFCGLPYTSAAIGLWGLVREFGMPLDPGNGAMYGYLIGAVITGAMVAITPQPNRSNAALVIGLASVAFAGPSVIFGLNRLLDTSPRTVHRPRLKEKRIVDGDKELKVSAWAPYGPRHLTVDNETYYSLVSGQLVQIEVGAGAFGLPWMAGVRKEGPPPVPPR
jgi:hypothetical protein